MQYVRLGSTGLKVSRLCLGCMTYGSSKWREWVLEEEESRLFLQRALEEGINFFDTADMYSLGVSEQILGRALRDFGPGRDKVVVATKVFHPMNSDPNGRGLSKKHILHAIDGSLTRLGMEYVDLYQIHRFDPETPIEETLDALDEVVRSGKALHIGASSMWTWQFAKMRAMQDANGWSRFATMQNHYNMVYREEEREMIPYCQDQGIGIIPWSPLARGFLAGNRTKQDFGETTRAKTDDIAQRMYYDDSDFAVVAKLSEIAEARGVPNAQVALAWLLGKPGVTAPIIGASKMKHLEDALAALDLKLEASELAALEEPYRPHGVLGHA